MLQSKTISSAASTYLPCKLSCTSERLGSPKQWNRTIHKAAAPRSPLCAHMSTPPGPLEGALLMVVVAAAAAGLTGDAGLLPLLLLLSTAVAAPGRQSAQEGGRGRPQLLPVGGGQREAREHEEHGHDARACTGWAG